MPRGVLHGALLLAALGLLLLVFEDHLRAHFHRRVAHAPLTGGYNLQVV